jgi:flagellar hook assembly protein FlgD
MKLKIFIVVSLFLIYKNRVEAQNFGFEWINFNQTYYKIKTFQTGIHRISQADLSNAGINGINPKQFQIFFRGQEQAIFVQGEEDNSFDAGDYIEFYGRRNDGELDRFLYSNPSNQTNPYYNLYSDTTSVFLTWKTDGTFGKRIVKDNTPFLTNNINFHWAENIQFFAEGYSLGQNYRIGTNEKIFLADFDSGEGWLSGIINGSRTFTFNIENLFNGVTITPPKLEIGFAGSTITGFSVTVQVGNSVGTLRNLSNFTGFAYQNITLAQDLLMTDITGTGQFLVRVNTGGVRVAYIKLTYPQTLTSDGSNNKNFNIPQNNHPISYLQINNVPSNSRLFDITDIHTFKELNAQFIGNNLQASITGTDTSPKNLYLYNNQPIANIPSTNIQRVFFTQITPNLVDYLIITHPRFRQAAGGYPDIAQAYANYRASAAGGSFKPLLMNIDVIYNQFSYGEKTPLAIRRLCDYLYQNTTLKYLFLIGKGAALPDENYNDLNIRQNPAHYALDLVPTGGTPASDNIFTHNLANTGAKYQLVPTGRLSVTQPEQVLNYLNKIIEHETPTDNRLWQKNFIHLSGGNNAIEQTLFRSYVDFYKSIAEGLFLGARVSTTSKSTTNPVELVNVSELVNKGTGLMNFFGHSSINVTDIVIGRASDDLQGYRNKGKYPLILTNGCQLGAVFYSSFTLSEDWMLTKDRGSIGFIGHSYFGYSTPLYEFSARFYNLICQFPTVIGQPIGVALKENARLAPSNVIDRSIAEQMVLQGDPAAKFIDASKVDYYTANNQVFLQSVDNSPITAASESFNVKFIVSNLGKIEPNKRIQVRVKRTYPNGQVSTFVNDIGYDPVFYRDTLSFTLYKEAGKDAFGLNRIEVTLDYQNQIDEMREDNNVGVIEFLFPKVGVLPIYPKEYAIVNTQPVTLTAMASSLRNEGKQFIMEIDTVNTFNSGAKQSVILDAGIMASWDVNLLSDNSTDSTVYYWRVNYVDDVTNTANLWGESSFIYIKNSPEGWSQSRFPQFSKTILTDVKRNLFNQQWEFQPLNRSIIVRTFGANSNANININTFLDYAGPQITGGTECGMNTIVAVAFRADTGNPYLVQNIPNQCGQVIKFANFYDNTQILNGALNTYLGAVNNGDYVLFFTKGNINFSTWGNNLFQVFAQIGGNSNIFTTLQTGSPYIILGRKGGNPGSASEMIASNLNSADTATIQLSTNLDISTGNGQIAYSLIGPATNWKEIIHTVKKFQNDSYKLEVYGVNSALVPTNTPIIPNVNAPQMNLNGVIDPVAFPYLLLKLHLKDEVNKTPPQLKKWMVLYDGLPEGLIDVQAVGAVNYIISPKTEGENFNLPFAFKNISSFTYATDSLQVTYTLKNLQTFAQTVNTIKIKAPAPRQTINFSRLVNTLGLNGKYELQVFVNPSITPEAIYENNVLVIPFEVKGDRTNPLLEVTFDGRKIMDGEIVSPNPIIAVGLRDDNRFLIPNDPNLLKIALKRPCPTCVFEDIQYNNPNVTWAVQNGVLVVNIKENNLPNGIYTLRAQGKDVAGNYTGIDPYIINFEVVRENTITNVFPYPNPFSTGAKFVFTLTGNIPDEMKIQIMTVNGQVVREITQAELGNLKVGNNLTDFIWDGTDESGQKLANGVYLYRVIARKNGENLEQRATAADKAFKNGLGKIYIAR